MNKEELQEQLYYDREEWLKKHGVTNVDVHFGEEKAKEFIFVSEEMIEEHDITEHLFPSRTDIETGERWYVVYLPEQYQNL